MIFHENRLLADDSRDYHILFFPKLGKMSQNLSSAAVVIGALRVKKGTRICHNDLPWAFYSPNSIYQFLSNKRNKRKSRSM